MSRGSDGGALGLRQRGHAAVGAGETMAAARSSARGKKARRGGGVDAAIAAVPP